MTVVDINSTYGVRRGAHKGHTNKLAKRLQRAGAQSWSAYDELDVVKRTQLGCRHGQRSVVDHLSVHRIPVAEGCRVMNLPLHPLQESVAQSTARCTAMRPRLSSGLLAAAHSRLNTEHAKKDRPLLLQRPALARTLAEARQILRADYSGSASPWAVARTVARLTVPPKIGATPDEAPSA